METIDGMLEQILERGGFRALTSIGGIDLLGNKDVYYAVPTIKKCEVSKLADAGGNCSGAEYVYTAALRCMGRDCRYTDREELDIMIGKMIRYIRLVLNCTVRSVIRGETVRCSETRRLEETVCVTVVGYEEYEG